MIVHQDYHVTHGRTNFVYNNYKTMQNIDSRLTKFLNEREELRKKISELKKPIFPLSKRLKQVSKNIETLKTLKNKSKCLH